MASFEDYTRALTAAGMNILKNFREVTGLDSSPVDRGQSSDLIKAYRAYVGKNAEHKDGIKKFEDWLEHDGIADAAKVTPKAKSDAIKYMQNETKVKAATDDIFKTGKAAFAESGNWLSDNWPMLAAIAAPVAGLLFMDFSWLTALLVGGAAVAGASFVSEDNSLLGGLKNTVMEMITGKKNEGLAKGVEVPAVGEGIVQIGLDKDNNRVEIKSKDIPANVTTLVYAQKQSDGKTYKVTGIQTVRPGRVPPLSDIDTSIGSQNIPLQVNNSPGVVVGGAKPKEPMWEVDTTKRDPKLLTEIGRLSILADATPKRTKDGSELTIQYTDPEHKNVKVDYGTVELIVDGKPQTFKMVMTGRIEDPLRNTVKFSEVNIVDPKDPAKVIYTGKAPTSGPQVELWTMKYSGNKVVESERSYESYKSGIVAAANAKIKLDEVAKAAAEDAKYDKLTLMQDNIRMQDNISRVTAAPGFKNVMVDYGKVDVAIEGKKYNAKMLGVQNLKDGTVTFSKIVLLDDKGKQVAMVDPKSVGGEWKLPVKDGVVRESYNNQAAVLKNLAGQASAFEAKRVAEAARVAAATALEEKAKEDATTALLKLKNVKMETTGKVVAATLLPVPGATLRPEMYSSKATVKLTPYGGNKYGISRTFTGTLSMPIPDEFGGLVPDTRKPTLTITQGTLKDGTTYDLTRPLTVDVELDADGSIDMTELEKNPAFRNALPVLKLENKRDVKGGIRQLALNGVDVPDTEGGQLRPKAARDPNKPLNDGVTLQG